MTLEDSKAALGPSWLLHPAYDPSAHEHHSSYAQVNVALTFMRVRHRLRKERSFAGAVEQVRRQLRAATGLRRVA